MSIYATLGQIKVAKEECWPDDEDWVEVMIQSVPAFIGHPTEGHRYGRIDPYAEFLPPVTSAPDPEADGLPPRAVVFVADGRDDKLGQRYIDPLLVVDGETYRDTPFPVILETLEWAVRNPRETPQLAALREAVRMQDEAIEAKWGSRTAGD